MMKMTDRERLTDLIKKAEKQELLDFFTADLDEAIDMSGGTQFNGTVEHLTDYLLEHGVIVLPCKVGDTVYYITGIGHNLVKPAKVKEIIIDENGIKDLYVQGDGYDFENSFDIFFLTREEAEKALKERESK